MPVFKHPMHGLIAPFSLKEDQIRTKIEIEEVKKGCYPCYFSISLLPLQGKGLVQHTRSVIVCGKHKNVMRSCGRGKIWEPPNLSRTRPENLPLYLRICRSIHEN